MKFNKLLLSTLLLTFCMMLFSVDADAQSRKKKKKKRPTTEDTRSTDKSSNDRSTRETKVTVPLKDRFAYELKFGNINLGAQVTANVGGSTIVGSATRMGFKPAVSYKIIDRISAGIAPKYQFTFYNFQAPFEDFTFADYGFGLFARGRIIESLHLMVEYDLNWFGNFLPDGTKFHEYFPGVLVGGGYTAGFGKWTYGVDALFMASNTLRDRIAGGFPFEIYAGVNYNF